MQSAYHRSARRNASLTAVRIGNKDGSRVGSITETQPQFQPTLLRLSAMEGKPISSLATRVGEADPEHARIKRIVT